MYCGSAGLAGKCGSDPHDVDHLGSLLLCLFKEITKGHLGKTDSILVLCYVKLQKDNDELTIQKINNGEKQQSISSSKMLMNHDMIKEKSSNKILKG